MKNRFKLIINIQDGNTEERLYTSLLQLSKDIDSTYCSVYNNYLFNLGEMKAPKKRCQLAFNKKYKIVDL